MASVGAEWTSAGQISKAVTLLNHMVAQPGPVGVTHLAHVTKLPKSTVHRTLAALVDAGVVQRVGGVYALDNGWLYRMQDEQTYWDRHLRLVAAPFLLDLHTRTRLACDLAVLRGARVRFLVSMLGHRDASALMGVYGKESMPQRTAAGMLLLATAAGGEMNGGLVYGEPVPGADRIRATGLAVSEGKLLPGFTGVATAVRVGGGVVAAVTAGGPAGDVEVGRVGRLLGRTAYQVSRRLMQTTSARLIRRNLAVPPY